MAQGIEKLICGTLRNIENSKQINFKSGAAETIELVLYQVK